ncbi:sugar transferase [Runella sp. MFBS21]|uniref:sugar transferase n=1 Tax=Runella sp. MFBS21 TaxID=3034018 RepID=UPI0023F77AA4|nr:sugar transferase [Runella sp. MFBS21]MDF7821629.1 sugar transferase [Runella sp. MFBS21]
MQTNTHGKVVFRVVYVENDPQLIATFTKDFADMVEITLQQNQIDALEYLEKGNLADLVVVNDSLGYNHILEGIDYYEYMKHLAVIVLSTVNESKLTNQALKKHIIDVFGIPYPTEALKIRFQYLIQKKEYKESKKIPYTHSSIRMPVGKRAFDIVVSFTALLFLSPLLLIVAVLVKLDSKGPIFYGSRRVGMGYKMFNMYKFRTMRTGADKLISSMSSLNLYNTATPETDTEDYLCEACQLAGTECQRPLFLDNEQVCEDVYHKRQKAKATFMKFKEDPRVTRLGKILRNTSIDELPQLFNILIGDMSFVGNRPLPPYEAEKLTATGYARRFAAPAGLTGLWQVTKRGKAKVSDIERIQLDVLYAKKYSFTTDLVIMLKTVKALFQKENV